jgi:hypothetical protein
LGFVGKINCSNSIKMMSQPIVRSCLSSMMPRQE